MKVCPSCRTHFHSCGWKCPACGKEPPSRGDIIYFAPTLCAGDGLDATYTHDELDRAEQRHFWFRARANLIAWALDRHFPELRSLFDAGCGRGSVLAALRRRFPAAVLAGGELLEEGVRLARLRLPTDIQLYQIDVRDLPFESEFDVVTSLDVLEHIDDDRSVVRQLFRAVAPGGGVVVTVPQHRWLWSAVDTYSHHRRRYRRKELVAVLSEAGFEIERVTSFVTTVLPLIVLSRLQQTMRRRAFDPTAELRIGEAANAVLEKALDAEQWMIRAGASLPIGSSLLVVARRPAK